MPRGGHGCLARAEPPQSPSCCLPFTPAIRAPASTLPACANTETHLNKLRRHNKSKGNEGLCLGAGESLEFNYIGKPFATKAQRVPHAVSADVQTRAQLRSRAGGTAPKPVPSTAPAQHQLCRVRKAGRVPAEVGPGHWPLLDPQQRVPTRAGCIPAAQREPWHAAAGSSPGAAGSAQCCRGAAGAACGVLLAAQSHRARPRLREKPAAPLHHRARFTARPPLFKDSHSRLWWGLQKELCVEAANL